MMNVTFIAKCYDEIEIHHKICDKTNCHHKICDETKIHHKNLQRNKNSSQKFVTKMEFVTNFCEEF